MATKRSVVFKLSLLTLLCTIPGLTQCTSPEEANDLKEIEALKEGQKAIQKELQEIKSLLGTRPAPVAAPPEFVLDIEGNPFKGDGNAKLTLIEFTDYQ